MLRRPSGSMTVPPSLHPTSPFLDHTSTWPIQASTRRADNSASAARIADEDEDDEEDEEEDDEEHAFACDLCGEMYQSSRSLKQV